MFRTGRKAEADHQIDELLDSNTSDENALNIIMQYCKETQQVSKIVYFYEKAAAKYQNEPALVGTVDHEDIMSSLFYAYVRVRDFSKQQQVAGGGSRASLTDIRRPELEAADEWLTCRGRRRVGVT